MNPDQILDQIIQANPKPAEGQAPGTVMTRAALLVELDRRSGDMQTQDKPASQKTKPTSPPASPSRPRRLIPALGGAVAVMVALVIGVVLLSSSEEPVSQYAEAAAGGEPDAIFGLFAESYRTGDVEGALPYVDADLSATFTDMSDPITWMQGVIEFEGALYGRDEPGPSVCEGPDESGWLSCTFTEDPNGLLAAAGYPELTYRGKVADGRLVTFEWPERAEDDRPVQGAFDSVERPLGEYAAAIDPEGMAAQCDVARGLQTGELTSGFPVVHNQQCGAFLAGFVDDYQATLGGAADLATAEQFLAALQSGDVAGYEALVDSDVMTPVGPFFGASSATWAYVSGFQAATHGTYTAECRATPTSPTIDVTCTIRESNIFRETAGLDPEYTGASFGIEDGTITLINLGGDLIFPALDQITLYDGWLQVNYPEEYAGLMAALDETVVIRTCTLDVSGNLLETCGAADGEIDPLLPMPVVDTAAQRARHSELTTEWAATLP